MHIVELNSLEQAGIEAYATLTEAQLRNRLEPEKGIFIAESPKVILVAFDAGCVPVSLLCERRHLEGDAAPLLRCMQQMEEQGVTGDLPVYTGSRDLLARLTGYTLTRGVLCAMRRPAAPSLEDVCREASRVAVIHGVVDSTNVGAIFRAAAALGIDAVVMSPDSCDPLNRRAVRVSMGSVFLVPWTWAGNPVAELRRMGFLTVALALTDESVPIDSPVLKDVARMAIIMGTEGDGLPRETIAEADRVARIPMMHGVDSLNVAAAAAVAFWELRATRNIINKEPT